MQSSTFVVASLYFVEGLDLFGGGRVYLTLLLGSVVGEGKMRRLPTHPLQGWVGGWTRLCYFSLVHSLSFILKGTKGTQDSRGSPQEEECAHPARTSLLFLFFPLLLVIYRHTQSMI